GVVGEREAPVHAAPTACAAQHHPAAGEGVAELAETAHPGAASGRGRGDDEGAAQCRVGFFEIAGVLGFRDAHAGFAVYAVQGFDGAVDQNRADAGVDA
nr:hypothetical protein [Tanacetum cinerariifolium]